MKKQMAILNHKGHYKVIFDDSQKTNPYRVIKCVWSQEKRSMTQKTVGKYADMASCMWHLYMVTTE